MTEASSTIRALARAVRAVPADGVSPAAMRQAQLLLLDTIGCGLAGAREPAAQALAEFALANAGKPQCVLIGRGQRTDVLNAVLANGAAIRVLDWNDYFVSEAKGEPEAGGHPSDNIPVALAVAGARGRSGAETLRTIAIGYELYARLQHLMNRAGVWDGVTVSGLVAAAMAGRLMELDEEPLSHALALAAARAPTPSAVRSGHLSAAKSIANALVAEAGVQAALLAERGLTGPLAILDDPRGLRDLFSHADPALLIEPIPQAGAIMRALVKTYPCINTGQSAVAAALRLHEMFARKTSPLPGPPTPAGEENISRIEIVMADYKVTKRHQEDPGRARPQSREAADHSFPFLVAVALIDGQFGIAQFENERWRDPHVVALMERTVMRRDAGWNARAPGGFPCTIRAWDSAGHEHVAEIPYPPGFSRDGLDADSVIAKFHSAAASILSEPRRARVVDAVMEFHHSPSAKELEAAIATEEMNR